jgi:hypothetical protein
LFEKPSQRTRPSEAVAKLIVQTRLIAVETSELPANLFGIRTQCRLDDSLLLCTGKFSEVRIFLGEGAPGLATPYTPEVKML